ncbi:LLM class F420-dependent oxidoreductase [Kribbella sandramycini]|uniref:F420-dependent oxidoreductase-like protein n=1 Tax=Kribbella sandramycini TaxID=60450 RepID=A0A7Y4L1D8_9ACTN|nr:LLM class F420-dependent oxidoreductase [Kribbella sandramycini]MBB6564852.1 F420-dependent oxidoreductase-like protein [Kribbella sandramycini]NOL42550.1 LLM class F420-dependent oxidoreductase [Kribbella sandramycini]
MSTRFGIFVPQGWKMDLAQIADPVEQWEAMTAVAKRADEQSWDSIWLFDHFHTVPEPSDNTTFECWSATAALARDTKRVNIGQMVGCNGYRNPALYAKIASTVDVASHGRLYAGIGAGWYEHEWKAYGYEWQDVKPRMAAFREATEIIHKMWTEDRPVYQGKHHSIDGPINLPKGAGNTKPKFWIGGGGPQVTLKLVAQYADAANIGGGNPEVIREKAAILKGHCDKLGRDYDEIIKSTGINVFPIDKGDDPQAATERARGPIGWDRFAKDNNITTEDEIALKVEAALEAGADYVIFYIPGVAYDLDLVDRVEQVAKRFA